MRKKFTPRPVAVGIAAAIGAVALGCLYLLLAGAPMRMLLMNAAALLIGVAALMMLRAAAKLRLPAGGPLLVAMSLLILATALFGASIDNVSRWVSVAGITIQPSLMLVPAFAVAFAARESRWTAAAVIIAAAGVALQPDRAMAAALLTGVGAITAVRRNPLSLAALAASAIAFAAAMIRPDPLPPVPFVDGVYSSAFAVGPLAGLAVIGGSALLLAPLIFLSRPPMRTRLMAFAAVWLAMIAAAAAGNYPTPVVGFGGSAIVGYLLSIAALGTSVSALRRSAAIQPAKGSPGRSRHHDLLKRA